jgi:phosphoribosylglycinamide formyltransferase-1
VIGVLVSGMGTNLQALIDAKLPIAAVAANKRCMALTRAQAWRIPTSVFEAGSEREKRDVEMANWLESHGVRLVVLAGYMQILTRPFLERFHRRIVNVHPSLLPAFPGLNAIEQALAAGVETTGVTIHWVDEGVDTGPVIRQEAVPVEPLESLEKRIHEVEHRLLPEVVRALCAR